MKRTFISTILVLVLLATAGIAYAYWEETQSTQVTATILALPEGTFQIVGSSCDDAALGYEAHCYITIRNLSSTVIRVTDMSVTCSDPHVSIELPSSTPPLDPLLNDSIYWNYTSDPVLSIPGEITFDVEITLEGDYD